MPNFDKNELVRLAVDGYNGNVEKFSVKQSQEAMTTGSVMCSCQPRKSSVTSGM